MGYDSYELRPWDVACAFEDVVMGVVTITTTKYIKEIGHKWFKKPVYNRFISRRALWLRAQIFDLKN